MNFQELSQFDRKLFKKMFGVHVQSKRHEKGISLQELSEQVGIAIMDLKSIESGQKKVEQNQFENLKVYLGLENEDLMEMFRITQVHSLSEAIRVFNDIPF